MGESNIGNYPHLYLSIQQALLGEVVINLRGVAFVWESETIILYFYHDGIASDEDVENYSNISACVVANYHAPVVIDEKTLNLSTPNPLPEHKHWAYRRKEILKNML